MIMHNKPVSTRAPRRDLMRFAAHSVNAAAPPDIMTSAVTMPNWNKNATIRMVNQLISPSTHTSRTTASQIQTTILTGLNSARTKPATTAPAPSETSTFLVTMTKTIAISGGNRVSIGYASSTGAPHHESLKVST